MLQGLLIFPDWHANGLPESIKPGKNTAFPPQTKCLTHSATEKSTSELGVCVAIEMRRGIVDFSRLARKSAARFKDMVHEHGFSASIEMLDAFRYGKINTPWTHSAMEKSTRP